MWSLHLPSSPAHAAAPAPPADKACGTAPRQIATQRDAGFSANGVLSVEEADRLERLRQANAGGVSSLSLSHDRTYALFTCHSALYVTRLTRDTGTEAQLLVPAREDAPILDPQPSPAGNWVAYVWRNEVYISPVHLDSAQLAPMYRVTTGAQGLEHVRNGMADYLSEEELDRYRGFWWSPDGQYICYQHTDSSAVAVAELQPLPTLYSDTVLRQRVACEGDAPLPRAPISPPMEKLRGSLEERLRKSLAANGTPASDAARGALSNSSGITVSSPAAHAMGEDALVSQRRGRSFEYPFVGTSNPSISLHVVNVSSILQAPTPEAREVAQSTLLARGGVCVLAATLA
ncbi:hypothetical protein EON62_05625 [archaeon]|nr:MAG: hypothetical protein EON62_05625 [archaeon]